jgi:hypothetical protein
MLPDPVPPVAESDTGSFPAIVDDTVRPGDGAHPDNGAWSGNGVRSGSASRDWFAE